MSRNVSNLRFSVFDASVGHSAVWRLWITRPGDLYLASRAAAGSVKVSFHRSGICRYAFTRQHRPPASESDRVIQRWNRPALPEAGTGNFARLAWLAFPTDYLSQGPMPGLSDSTTIPPAAPGAAAFVEVGLTQGPLEAIAEGMGAAEDRGIASYSEIFEGTAAFVRWYHGAWENNDLTIPASHGLPAYRFLAEEPVDRVRPIRLTFHSQPKDGEALLITELGGCSDTT